MHPKCAHGEQNLNNTNVKAITACSHVLLSFRWVQPSPQCIRSLRGMRVQGPLQEGGRAWAIALSVTLSRGLQWKVTGLRNWLQGVWLRRKTSERIWNRVPGLDCSAKNCLFDNIYIQYIYYVYIYIYMYIHIYTYIHIHYATYMICCLQNQRAGRLCQLAWKPFSAPRSGPERHHCCHGGDRGQQWWLYCHWGFQQEYSINRNGQYNIIMIIMVVHCNYHSCHWFPKMGVPQ